MIFRIAFRNLFRNPSRTFATMAAIGFGVLVCIPAFGLALGVSRALKTGITGLRNGDITVSVSSPDSFQKSTFTVAQVSAGLDSVKQIKWVERLRYPAKIYAEKRIKAPFLYRKCNAVRKNSSGSCDGYIPEKYNLSTGISMMIDVPADGTSCISIIVQGISSDKKTVEINDCSLENNIPYGDGELIHQISEQIMFTGTDFQKEREVSDLHKKITQGKWDTDGETVVLGQKLLSKLETSLTGKVTIIFAPRDGIPIDNNFTVGGVFKSRIEQLDSSEVLVPINVLRRIENPYGKIKYANEIAVKTRGIPTKEAIPVIKRKLDKKFRVIPWWESLPSLARIVDFNEGLSIMILSIILLMAAMGTMNTMMMVVMERKREFGMLRALGMSPSKLVLMVTIESFLLVFFSMIIGGTAGVGLLKYLSVYGIDLSFLMQDGLELSGLVIEPIWKARFALDVIIKPVIILSVVTILASLWPAIKASQSPAAMDIVEEN
ncbi:FtsX-like permease family protein [Myxococcota bacterium]|nr:FtsX-like permease family protein [Myxococcota bacterium]MBU1381642.1 FtsX-like permease family protein [Myxococcota bacterium]MBU1495471.1 FtsX-like permease family protein [Myxococcota bacterium]